MNVQGPNGVVVNFPDGTDPAIVDSVMRQNFSGTPAQSAAPDGPAALDPSAPNPATTPAESGTLLPLTRYQDGHVGFDSNAGVVGFAKSAAKGLYRTAADALNLTGETAKGNVDLSNPETIAAAIPTALGAASLISPATPGAQILSTGTQAVAAPTADALRAAGGAGRDAARDMGVSYASPSVADMARAVQEQANSDGALRVLAPQSHSLLDALQAVPAGSSSVPFGSLDAARKAFGRVTQNFGPDAGHDRYVAGLAKDAIDNFVTAADPSSVVAGPAAAAASTVRDAIANSAAGFRSDRLNGIEDAAGLRADAANSGQNIGNATRQRAASLLLNRNAASGFNADELAAIRGVTEGTAVSNTARTIGNLLGGGGGMHGAMTGVTGAVMGHEAGGLPGAVIGGLTPAVGWAAKSLDNNLTTGRLNAADLLTRQRSPLYTDAVANAPQVVNVGQTLANGAARPLSGAFVLNGVNSSIASAPPDSRAASLGAVLAGTHPAFSALSNGSLGGIFGNLDSARAAFAP